MAQFVRTRLRCALLPSKIAEKFRVQDTGNPPQIFKGAGCEFELGIFVDSKTPFDVSNVGSLTVMAKTQGVPGSAPVMLKATAAITNIASLDTWNDGTEQHAVVVFSGTETNIAAGTYDLTVFGFTTDDGLDQDVFGISTLTIVDAGLTNTVAPPVGGSPGVSLLDVQNLLGNYVKRVRNPGDVDTWVSKNGLWRRITGIDDNGNRIDDLEQ